MTRSYVNLLERLPLCRDFPYRAYGWASGICAIALLTRLVAEPVLPPGYPFVSFFPAVILSTFLFGRRPGIFAGLICGILAWYCFIPPAFTFKLSGGILFALGFYGAVVVIDIILVHWLQDALNQLAGERERNRRLAERGELLFRELQHRVSNNLQVVSGLLSLQMRDISDPAARTAMEEASRRLGLIGRIHRQLYDPGGEQLQLSAFLDQLGTDLIDASGRNGITVRIEAIEQIDLPPQAAVPMALIVAEAIANAMEHGFAGRDDGLIVIRIERGGDGLIDLTIRDDGAGLPDGFDLAACNSLGLRIAQMLARQLDGAFSLTGGPGATARLRIPDDMGYRG